MILPRALLGKSSLQFVDARSGALLLRFFLIVSLPLVVIALILAVEMKGLLIGEAASDEHLDAIHAAIDGAPKVNGLIHLRTMHLGPDDLLVAAKIDPDRIDEAAEAISRHPGVSHNYKRNHAYNLWYTLAVPPGEDFDEHLDTLARREHHLVAVDRSRDPARVGSDHVQHVVVDAEPLVDAVAARD